MDIHNTSNHPTQHKHAAFNHMLHRLTKIPLNKQDYTDELNTIKYIPIKNGYNPNLINILHKRIKNKNNKTITTKAGQLVGIYLSIWETYGLQIMVL